MSVTQVFELVKKYADSMEQPSEKMIEVLTFVSDEYSIPLKVYGPGMEVVGEPRQVLDVHSVTMVNFMGVSKRVINVEPGVTLLYGPNGSGKSTTMRALLYTLFGAAAAGVRTAETLIANGQSELEAAVTFSGGKVTRGVERKTVKRGANIGAENAAHMLSVSIAGDKASKAKEAQALIDGWLGVDGEFVRRVCCLEQGMLTQLMDEQPARRRELFYRMLSLDPAEETRKALSRALQVEEDKRSNQSQNGEKLQQELKSLVHRRNGYPVRDLEARRKELMPQAMKDSVNPAEVKQAEEALARRELDLISAKNQVENRRGYLSKINDLKRDPDMLVEVLDVSTHLESSRRSLSGCQSEHSTAKAKLEVLTQKGQKIRDLPSICPVCEVIGKRCEVTQDVKDASLTQIRQQWSEVSRTVKALEDKCFEWSSKIDGYFKAQEEAQRVQSRQRFVLEQIGLLEQAIANISDSINLDAIKRDILKLSETLTLKKSVASPAVNEELKDIDAAIAEARSLDAQIGAVESKVSEMNASPIMDNAHLEALRFVTAAFAKDGLPLWLARQHLERINAIAEELCTLDKYKYRFGPELDVQVISADFDMGAQLACGSARERGSVVLMASLGRYLQELSGLQIPLLWIDELPFQDEANTNLVVDMVKRLTRWYPKVVLCASRWDEYLEQFDHEIALLPEDVAIELDRQRQAKVLEQEGPKPAPKEKKPKAAPEPAAAPPPAAEEKRPYRSPTMTRIARDNPQTPLYVALCPTHGSEVDATKVKVIPSPVDRCVDCRENREAIATVPAQEPTEAAHHKSPLAEAEAALAAAAPKMDADLEEDCPF